MKLSKLIKTLKKSKELYGDIEVCVDTTDINTINFCPIKEINLLDSDIYKRRYTNFKDGKNLYIGIS